MGRRKHDPDFKVKVALEALSERHTIQELGRRYEVHPTQVTTYKTRFPKNAPQVLDRPVKDAESGAEEKEDGYLKMIGQQKMEIDFLKKALS